MVNRHKSNHSKVDECNKPPLLIIATQLIYLYEKIELDKKRKEHEM